MNRAIGVQRPHGHVPNVAAAADMRQMPLVKAIRPVIEPLRVRHEIVDAAALVDLIELGVERSHIETFALGRATALLHYLRVGGVHRIRVPSLQIRHDVAVLSLIRIIPRHDVAGRGNLLLDEFVVGAVAARIAPGPDVGLLSELEDIVPRSGYFVIVVSGRAERLGIGTLARMLTGVGADLMTIVDGLPEPRPQFPHLQLIKKTIFRSGILLRAHEYSCLDAVFIHGIDAVGDVFRRIVDGVSDDRAGVVEIFCFSN